MNIKKAILTTVAIGSLGAAVIQTASIASARDYPHPWLLDQWDHSSKNGSKNAYSNYYVTDTRSYGSISYCTNGYGKGRASARVKYGSANSSHKQDNWDLGTLIYPDWNVFKF